MANFYGPQGDDDKGTGRWHLRPTMYGSGTIDASRENSRVHLHLVAYTSTRSGSTASQCTSCRIVCSDGWKSRILSTIIKLGRFR